MNIRVNPETGVAEIQVSEDEWRDIEEVAAEAGDRPLRAYLQERYGRVIETVSPASSD